MAGIQTYLYVKQHTVTGKLYFGKTVRDPLKYRGSGTVCNRHINVHGKEHVETLWCEPFDDQEECTRFALEFSEKMNIVKSDQWLNLIPENGLCGQIVGYKHSIEAKEKISEAGRNRSPEHKVAQIARQTGSHHQKHKSYETGRKKHKKFSEESKLRLSRAVTLSKLGKKQAIVTCPHCEKTGGTNTMHQWHFDHCKQHTIGVN